MHFRAFAIILMDDKLDVKETHRELRGKNGEKTYVKYVIGDPLRVFPELQGYNHVLASPCVCRHASVSRSALNNNYVIDQSVCLSHELYNDTAANLKQGQG